MNPTIIYSLVLYFIAAIYFYRVIDLAEPIGFRSEDVIIIGIVFIFWPLPLITLFTVNKIKFHHFIRAITSFFDKE